METQMFEKMKHRVLKHCLQGSIYKAQLRGHFQRLSDAEFDSLLAELAAEREVVLVTTRRGYVKVYHRVMAEFIAQESNERPPRDLPEAI